MTKMSWDDWFAIRVAQIEAEIDEECRQRLADIALGHPEHYDDLSTYSFMPPGDVIDPGAGGVMEGEERAFDGDGDLMNVPSGRTNDLVGAPLEGTAGDYGDTQFGYAHTQDGYDGGVSLDAEGGGGQSLSSLVGEPLEDTPLSTSPEDQTNPEKMQFGRASSVHLGSVSLSARQRLQQTDTVDDNSKD